MDRNTGKYAAWSAALLAAALLLGIGGGTAVQALAGSMEAPTLVIDAGHGGFDGGAIGSDGTAEQDINLSIARRVQALAGFFGVRTAMTRADENALDYDPGRPIRENKVADIRARERIVGAADSPVFVSIHLNKFSDPQYHGAQVFYSPNHADSKTLQAGGPCDLPDGPADLPGSDRGMRLPVQSGGGTAAEQDGISQKTRRLHRDRLPAVRERRLMEEI